MGNHHRNYLRNTEETIFAQKTIEYHFPSYLKNTIKDQSKTLQKNHQNSWRLDRQVTLLNYCNYVQWVPESDVVVAQNRGARWGVSRIAIGLGRPPGCLGICFASQKQVRKERLGH